MQRLTSIVKRVNKFLSIEFINQSSHLILFVFITHHSQIKIRSFDNLKLRKTCESKSVNPSIYELKNQQSANPSVFACRNPQISVFPSHEKCIIQNHRSSYTFNILLDGNNYQSRLFNIHIFAYIFSPYSTADFNIITLNFNS